MWVNVGVQFALWCVQCVSVMCECNVRARVLVCVCVCVMCVCVCVCVRASVSVRNEYDMYAEQRARAGVYSLFVFFCLLFNTILSIHRCSSPPPAICGLLHIHY